MRVRQVQLDELFALLSAVKDRKVSEAEAIERLERSPLWVWAAMDPESKRLLAIDVGYRTLAMAQRLVVYLSPADKSHRLTRRLSQGQKGLQERALMASQRPFHPWCRPQSRPCGHTDPASAHGNPSFPPLRSLPHACAGCGHGGTRKSNTSRSVQT